MKKFYKHLCLLTLLVTAHSVWAQREMIIEPMEVFNGIRDFVVADLAATDSATVANTKYILRRDATYAFTEEWRPTHHLWLEAEEGDGKRPVMLAVAIGENQAPSFCRVLNSLTWKGISFPGLDAAGAHTDNAPIRPRGDGNVARVDDCLIENQRLDVARMDGSGQSMYFTNNIIRNAYQRNLWHKGGGAFFAKGNKQDTVIWSGNTFFNSTCVVGYQNDGGGEGYDYLEFNNNTIVNVGGLQQPGQYNGVARHAPINLGVPQTAIVENNIFQNVGYMGVDSQFTDFHFQYLIRLTDSTKSVSFRNNNIFMDERLAAVPIPDSASAYPMWNPEMDSILTLVEGGGAPSFSFVYENNISEMLEFTNPASTVEEAIMVKELYWSAPGTIIEQELELDLSISTYDVDYAYSTNAMSYTAGTDGGPLGAPRWFGLVTSARDFAPSSEFKLAGNFPNPFSYATTVRFDLERPALIEVSIYDMSGREVRRIQPQHFPAGVGHQIDLNAETLNAGVYGYKVRAQMSDRSLLASDMMIVK